MSKNNFYAVRNGYTTGIFDTWAECKKQVDGFQNCEYKGFRTRQEAIDYLGEVPDNAPGKSSGRQPRKPLRPAISKQPEGIKTWQKTHKLLTGERATAIAYVDGSYDARTNKFAYGVVIFHDGREIYLNNSYHNKELSTMRNVAGELMGAETAMRWCLEQGVSHLQLYYDYEGIEKWATGRWEANKPGTKAYRHFCNSISNRLIVEFKKVKGHSGDKYNDLADSLAKAALGL